MRRPSTGMLAWRCRPLSHTHTHTSSCSSPYPRAPLYITEDAPHPHKHAVLPLSRGSTLRGLSAGPQHFVTRVNTPTAENHGGGLSGLQAVVPTPRSPATIPTCTLPASRGTGRGVSGCVSQEKDSARLTEHVRNTRGTRHWAAMAQQTPFGDLELGAPRGSLTTASGQAFEPLCLSASPWRWASPGDWCDLAPGSSFQRGLCVKCLQVAFPTGWPWGWGTWVL